jgi:hypothetical protein
MHVGSIVVKLSGKCTNDYHASHYFVSANTTVFADFCCIAVSSWRPGISGLSFRTTPEIPAVPIAPQMIGTNDNWSLT